MKVKITDIKPNPNNPRLVKDNKFAKLVQSIKDFPEMLELRPIVVNDDMIVLGGNMRLKACKEAGLKEVHIIKATQLTEEQQREFIIKDNLGYGEWDWEMIANEWDTDKLNEWGMDIPAFDDNFSEDAINENNSIEANNTVVITLTMPYYHYESAEKDLNEFIGKHPNVICKIQN